MTYEEGLSALVKYKAAEKQYYRYAKDKDGKAKQIKRVILIPLDLEMPADQMSELLFGSSRTYFKDKNTDYDLFFFWNYAFPTFYIRFDEFLENCEQ